MTLLAADSAKKKRTSRKRVRKRIKANRITDEERKLSRYPTKQLLHDARLAQARSLRGGVGSSLSRSAPVLPTAHPTDARAAPAPTPAPAGATTGAATVTAVAGAAVPPSVDTGGNAETGLDPRSMSPIELRRRSSGRIRARDIEHLTPAERLALMQERCVVALCGLLCDCHEICTLTMRASPLADTAVYKAISRKTPRRHSPSLPSLVSCAGADVYVANVSLRTVSRLGTHRAVWCAKLHPPPPGAAQRLSMSAEQRDQAVLDKIDAAEHGTKQPGRRGRRSSLANDPAAAAVFQPEQPFNPDKGVALPPVPGATKGDDGPRSGRGGSKAGGGAAGTTPTAQTLAEARRQHLAELRKKRRFGNYSRREVQHIKTLFDRLDKDQSGTYVICCV